MHLIFHKMSSTHYLCRNCPNLISMNAPNQALCSKEIKPGSYVAFTFIRHFSSLQPLHKVLISPRVQGKHFVTPVCGATCPSRQGAGGETASTQKWPTGHGEQTEAPISLLQPEKIKEIECQQGSKVFSLQEALLVGAKVRCFFKSIFCHVEREVQIGRVTRFDPHQNDEPWLLSKPEPVEQVCTMHMYTQ